MSPRTSRGLKIGVSLGLAVGLLYLFLRNLDFAEVGRAIAAADLGWLSLAFFVSLVVIPLRSWRWTKLLRRTGQVKLWDAITTTCIGFAATMLLPARAGEVVRPVALARKTRLPVAPLLASVGLERLLDLVAVILLFVVYAIGGWAPANLDPEAASRLTLIRRSAYLLGAGTLAGLVFFGFLAARPALTDKVVGFFLRVFPARIAEKVSSIVRSFVDGLGAVRSPAEIALIGASSIGLWMVVGVQIHASLRAFGVALPYPAAFFVLTWMVLGLAVPTPGGVGGYHAAAAYSLTGFYGVASSNAAAFALISHAMSFIPITIFGLVFLGAGGLSLGSLAEKQDGAPDNATHPAET